MSNKVQKALEEREKRKRTSAEKVAAALESHENRMKIKATLVADDIQKTYNSEIESFNTFATNNRLDENSGKWGKDIDIGGMVSGQRERLLTVSRLKRELEAYRGYLDESAVDEMLGKLNSVSEGYNGILTNANTLSKFNSKAEYDDAKKVNELYSMSSEEIAPYLDTSKVDTEVDTNRSALVTRQQEIKTKMKGLSGNKGRSYIERQKLQKELDEVESQIKELDSKKSNARIAHTTVDGQNITWQSLYDQKKEEEEFNAQYSSISSNEDFKASVSNAKSFENPSLNDINPKKDTYNKVTLMDAPYEEGSEMTVAQYLAVMELNGAHQSILDTRLLFMKEEEKNIYNYYFGRGEYNKAEEYLKSLEPKLQKRSKANEITAMAEFADKHPIISTAISPILTIASAGEYIVDTANYIKTGELGENHYANVNSTLRSTVSEKVDWEIGNWDAFDFLYNTGMSMADTVASTATFGSIGGATVLGLSAAAQGTNDALARGMDNKQAFWTGFFNGVAEGVFESVSIGNFKAMKEGAGASAKAIAKNIGKSMLVNASEETLTELANIAYDTIVNSDFSQYETMKRTYIAQGMTEEQAESQATKDFVRQVVEAGASGALMGFGFGTIGAASSTVKAVKKGKAIQEKGQVGNLVDLGMSLGEGTESYELANKVNDKASALAIGSLLGVAQDDILAANKGDIVKSLERKGYDTKKANRLADLMLDPNNDMYSRSRGFTPEGKTYSDIVGNPNSTYGQRTQPYLDILDALENGAESTSDTSAQGVTSIPYSNAHIDSVTKEFEEMGIPTDKARLLAEKKLSISTEGKSTPAEESIVESEFEVSADGKTINKGNGNIVKVKKIESISEDGEANLTLDDKMVVKASDLAFGSEAEAIIIENIGKVKIGKKPISTTSANALYMTAMSALEKNPNMTASEAMSLIKGLEESYIYGTYNLGRSKLTARNEDGSARLFAGELSQDQRAYAYDLGTQDRVSEVERDQKVIDDLKAKAEGSKDTSTKTTAKKGKVSFEKGAVAKGKNQKRAVALAKHLARAIGIDIVFYDSTLGGFGSDANGYFDEDTDTIYLDLQNSHDDAKTIAFTMSHELVHFIKKWSPAKYDTFAKFLMEQYAKHGTDTSELLSKKMTELKTDDADYAYEEMIADACETMLLDSNAVYKLMELRKTDLELFDKIKLHIHELLNKIRNMYKKLGLTPTSDEAKALLEMKDVLEQIYSLFEEAAVDAAQSYQAIQNSNEVVFGEASVDVGKTESGVKNQLKNHKKIGEDAIAYNDRHKNVHSAILKVGIESMYEMAETMLPYLEEEGILPPDIPGKTIFKNGSYGKTGENTTLCVRTLTYEDFKDRVAEELGRPLTVSESLLVSQKIYDIATEPQCIYCYVAADRKAYDGYLGEYWKAMDKYIKAMRKGGDSQALYTEYLAGRKDTNQQKKRWSQWEAIAKSGKEYISAKDLTTKRKRDALIAKKNAFSEQIKDAQRYAQSASWAKTVFDYRAYKGDILKMTSKFVDMLNSEYGLRMYSFSDYTPAFIVENMQMLIDASVKGLKSLAYTKDTDYAEIFASTGQAINVSCFAKWDAKSGTFVEDNRQGANWEKTKSLRKQYRNVGAVMVATNDAMVEWALKQDWVDVVIPYHIVKTGTTIANEYQWNNYTSESADRVGNKTANIYPTEHNNDFATYSNLLSERGITPRFSRWYDMVASGELTENQYMKLVNEVRLPASELSAVVPSFNLEAAKKSFGIDSEGKVIEGGFVDKGGYMGGWYRQGVDVNQEVMAVSEDIKAGKSSLDVDYGMSKAAKEKAEARYKKQAKKKDKESFVEDKYFKSQMQKWDSLSHGAYVKVGEVLEDHPLVKVGMPQGIVKYDVSKLKANIEKHKYLTPALLNEIPNIIANPVAISEYSEENTVSVFGDIFVGKSPMMVGVTISKDRSGANISKVRTFNARRDVGDLITDDTILYLDEDKKRTRTWFQACGIQVPLGETKFGFIRSIPQKKENVKKQLKKSSSSYAPTFYSQMSKVVEGVKQEKLAANSVVNMLRGKGVKAEEIRWSGIVPFLEGKKSVTKQELLHFINGSMLQIEEEISSSENEAYIELNKMWQEEVGGSLDEYLGGQPLNDDTLADIFDDMDKKGLPIPFIDTQLRMIELARNAESNVRWSQYKLDGGSNYRELVFTMPNSTYSNRAMRGHWGNDAEGILVHARIQDFEVNGKKMLFIEEIQSDWHNEGHSKGYSNKEYEDAVESQDKLYNEYKKLDLAFHKYVRSNEFMTDPEDVRKKKHDWLRGKVDTAQKKYLDAEKIVNNLKEKGAGNTPDAPFKDNYHEYVMKRLLRMAAEEGYDSIGWTPADIQSKRWSEDYAEAYRIEYDQEMPKFLRKYGRQWGAKVGKSRVGAFEQQVDVDSQTSLDDDAWLLEDGISFEGTEVWSMDITDSMKNSVLYEGQVMFQKKTATNRAILANALEGVAQNDIEKNKLNEYKEKIALIETEEQRLSEIQKQLFTKGAVEPEQRKDLQFEARQIANRINTYDRQLLRLEATKPLQNVLTREKNLAAKRQKQKDNERLKQYKEKVAKTQRELLERHKESRKNAIESREKTAMRHKIQKVVGDLNNLLLKPTKERHVPEEMKIAVAEALSIVNMDTVDADTRVARYNDLIAKASDPDVIASLTESRDRILEQGNKLADKLTKLKDAYGMVRDSTDDSLRSMYDDVIFNKIESVQRTVGKTPLRNMTLGQLESVYELYKMVLTTVRDSNKAFAENLKMTRLALGSNTFAEIKENNKARDRIKHEKTEKFLWQNLKPMQAMKKIGSGTLQKLWNNILYGQEVFAVDYDEAVKFAKEMKEKHGYKKWNKEKLYSFESKSGKTMKINLEQMMSIYAYSKRAQADEHIEYGGIVLNEGVIKEKNKLGKTVEVKVNDSTAYRLDKMQVAEIVATLDKEFPGAKAFVDEMQKYLSETMGAKGNEVSMKMYGINLFKEEHYFPLKSSKEFMEAANAKLKGDVKIKNKGMTKATVEHARNPIVLENFLDVWGNHINEMAMYHGLVLPLEDFSRTLNYSFKADEKLNSDAESVRTALHDAFGENADNYLNELLKAINGGVLHDSSAAIADKMISKFKKAKVMASLSVIVQQPTAIIRAMGIIDPKYFVAQNLNHKKTWEELKKYCPTAIIKETGSFDTNMGRTIVDMIKEDSGFVDKVGDVLGKAPAFMDEVGWNMIWRALKKKVATEQKLSGEALLQESGRQMTLILNETQVYDSVLARNELMRSKGAFTKMATAFMAEPATVANMVYGAALDFKRGKKGLATKTVAATIASVVINGLVSALVYAMRDDDEEKTWLEKYLSSATTEVVDGLNPLTYIPFIKDAYSLFQGYKVERTDMALIGDVVDAINNFYNVLDSDAYEGMSKNEIAKHIYENSVPMLTSICDMFGLPVGNILRDAKAIIVKDNVPMSQSSSKGIGDALKEGLLSALPKAVSKFVGTESKQDKLYDAIVSGNTAYVNRLKSGYKDDKAYETAVRKALRENDPRIKAAAEARIGGNIAEYTRIVKEIKAEGYFSQDTIVASVNAEINAINKGESTASESSESKASSMYKMDDYFDSIVGGDQASALVVKEDIINTDVTNGKDREEAEESFNSRFASYVREQYEDGFIAEDEAQRMLVDYGDKSEEDAASKVQYWEFKKEYPDYDDLSEEAVDKYYKDVEPHGISVDVYYDYSKQKAQCKGTDNNGDGKTDSGSKKAEILQVINSLPLTYAQKDALYYLNGWSAKTINEAPWH